MMDQPHPDRLSKLESLYAERPEGRVFTHLAEAYRAAGELELAREVVAAGLERHGEYPSAHVVHGRVLMDVGRHDDAEAAFRRVLELDRHNLAALRGLGDLARRDGRSDVALRHYRELLELDADQEVEALVDDLESDGVVGTDTPADSPERPPGDVAETDALDLTAGPAETGQAAATDSPGPDFAFDDPFAADDEGDAGLAGAGGPSTPGTDDFAADDVGVDDIGGIGDIELEPIEPGVEPDRGTEGAAAGPADDAEVELVDGFQAMEPVAPEADADAFADDEAYRGIGAGESVDAGGDAADAIGTDAGGTPFDAASADEAPVREPVQDAPAPGAAADVESVEDDGPGAADDLPLLLDPTAEDEGRVDDAGAGGAPAGGARPGEVNVDAGSGEAVGARDADGPGADAADVAGENTDAAEPYDATEVPTTGGLVTATMAELYARQGLYDRAAEVYRDLIARRPGDERLKERLADVEARAREAASQTPGVGGRPAPDGSAADTSDGGAAEPDWAAIEALAENLADGHLAARSAGSGPSTAEAGGAQEGTAEPQAVEAAWTAGAGAAGDEVTPYSWAEEPGAGESSAADGPTLREYFRMLLGWAAPRSAETASARTEPIVREDELSADEFDRLFEETEPTGAEEQAPSSGAPGRAGHPPEPAGDAVSEPAEPADPGDMADVGETADPAASAEGVGPTEEPAPESDQAEDGDDDDLEAFRAWLESLKR